MRGHKLPRQVDRHHSIFDSMENQPRLPKIGETSMLCGILEELVVDLAIHLIPIMEDREPSCLPPTSDRLLALHLTPAFCKSEGWRHQDKPIDLGMCGSI